MAARKVPVSPFVSRDQRIHVVQALHVIAKRSLLHPIRLVNDRRVDFVDFVVQSRADQVVETHLASAQRQGVVVGAASAAQVAADEHLFFSLNSEQFALWNVFDFHGRTPG